MRSGKVSVNQNTAEDHIYVIDIEKLLPGDILLSTVPMSNLHAVIRKGTRATLSHAAIYGGEGTFVEAVRPGVRLTAVGKVAAHDLAHVRMLRLDASKLANAADVGLEAGRIAAQAVGATYTKIGALLSPFRSIPVKMRDSYFCSHLIADAYKRAGCDLLETVDPRKVVPGSFLMTGKLADITNSVFQLEVGWPTIQRVFVDRPGMDAGAHVLEIGATQRLLKGLSAVFRKAGARAPKTIEEACLALISMPPDRREVVDHLFVEQLEASGYLDVHQIFSAEFEETKQIEKYVCRNLELNLMAIAEARALLDYYASWGPDEVRTRALTVQWYAGSYNRTPLAALGYLTALHGTLYEDSLLIDELVGRVRVLLTEFINTRSPAAS